MFSRRTKLARPRLWLSLSLRARLMVLVVLAVLPALGLIYYTSQEEQRILAGQVQENALGLTRLASADHERLIEGARQLLTGLARLPEIRRPDPRRCGEILADLADQYPFYTNFAIYAPDGSIICTGVPVARLRSSALGDWFTRAIVTSDFAVGEYQLGPTGRPTINFGYPVLDPGGRVRAVVSAALDLTWLNEVTSTAQLPPGSTLTVIDRRGTILIRHPDPRGVVGRSFPDVPIVETVLAEREGTAEAAGVDGIRKLYGFTRLRGTPPGGDVFLIIGIPNTVAFAAVNSLIARNLVILVLVAVLAVLASWLVGRAFVVRPVEALLQVTDHLSQGDLGTRTGLSYGADELGRLARSFDGMAEALESRDAQGRQLLEEVQGARKRLEALSRRLVEVQESERRHLARELHDEVGQTLTGLKLLLEVAARQARGAMSERLAEAQEAVNEVIGRVRQISLDLRPAMLDDLGLLPALLWQFERYTAQTGVQIAFSHLALDRRFPPEVETGAFRIVQEALTNVARHAGSPQAHVRLWCDDSRLWVQVEDRGSGFDAERVLPVSSTGLAGMRERTILLGGRLNVESAPGAGTRVTAEIPIDQSPNGKGNRE